MTFWQDVIFLIFIILTLPIYDIVLANLQAILPDILSFISRPCQLMT